MATILLAIGDLALREACRIALRNAGHTPVLLDRPLSALTLASKLRWDAACVDASPLGSEALSLLAGGDVQDAPLIGLGVEDDRLAGQVALPLVSEAFLACLEVALAPPPAQDTTVVLRLDAAHRSALANGLEVLLTRTEYRLLSFLLQSRPHRPRLQ